MLYSTQDVADILELSIQTVHNLRRSRKLRGSIKMGRSWQFTGESIDSYINELSKEIEDMKKRKNKLEKERSELLGI